MDSDTERTGGYWWGTGKRRKKKKKVITKLFVFNRIFL